MENASKNKALYHRLVDLLQERIETCMIPHDKPPSERELIAQYRMSRTTVRLALQELKDRGPIYHRHDKGTFVSDIEKEATDLTGAYNFIGQMKELGRKPHIRILSLEKLETDKSICQHLNLSSGEAVFKLSRLRVANNEPLVIEDTYLPARFLLSLTDQLLRSKSLYDLFSEDFKQTIRLTDEGLYASIASKRDTKLLMIPERAPVLHLARQTYSMRGEAIEFALSAA